MTDAKASSTTSQAASVMLAAGRLDDGARSGVHRADEASDHPRQSTVPATASPDPRCGQRLQSDGATAGPKSQIPSYDGECYLLVTYREGQDE